MTYNITALVTIYILWMLVAVAWLQWFSVKVRKLTYVICHDFSYISHILCYTVEACQVLVCDGILCALRDGVLCLFDVWLHCMVPVVGQWFVVLFPTFVYRRHTYEMTLWTLAECPVRNLLVCNLWFSVIKAVWVVHWQTGKECDVSGVAQSQPVKLPSFLKL